MNRSLVEACRPQAQGEEPEIWKEAAGYPGYEVSTFGRVRLRHSGKLLKTSPKCAGDKGPHRLSVRKDGKKTTVQVCKLVAATFLPGASDCKFVHFKDKNPLNCRVSNLEWSKKLRPVPARMSQAQEPEQEPVAADETPHLPVQVHEEAECGHDDGPDMVWLSLPVALAEKFQAVSEFTGMPVSDILLQAGKEYLWARAALVETAEHVRDKSEYLKQLQARRPN